MAGVLRYKDMGCNQSRGGGVDDAKPTELTQQSTLVSYTQSHSFSSPRHPADTTPASGFQGGKTPAPAAAQNDNTGDGDPNQEGVPDELRNITFSNQAALEDELERIGQGDLVLVLDKSGYAIVDMPSDFHEGVVEDIQRQIQVQWPSLRLSHIGIVKLPRAVNGFKTRHPDCSIYVPQRLTPDGRSVLTVSDLHLDMNPSVAIQFSWTSTLDYKEKAIEDMMLHAGTGGHDRLGRVQVGILIKTLFHRTPGPGSPVYGFDIYYVMQDQRLDRTQPDISYRVGEAEDGVITIQPTDFGLPLGTPPANYPLSDIRLILERKGIQFEVE